MSQLKRQETRILLFESVHPKAVEYLEDQGFVQVERLTHALDQEALVERIRDVHLIGIRSRTKLTAEVLAEATKLHAVGCFCIGTNQVDLEAAADRGVAVFNAPHSSTRSVAEMVIGLTVMLMRGTFAKSAAAHRQQWHKSVSGSHEVRGKVMGIVGYGHIGSQVSILAEAMGMSVIFHDIKTKLPLGNARAKASLDEVLEQSDLVTLHVPEDETTRGLLSRERIAQIKPGACLINASRGCVVDIDAAAEALRDGRLAGAAIDVFPVEPKAKDQPFESPLVGLDQVILTPHVGGSTLEAQQNIAVEVARKLHGFVDLAVSEGAANFPEVNLRPKPGTRRLTHVHRNVPGMLQQVNKAIADADINVLGQYLATNAQIGYVVLDIETAADQLLAQLERIEGTIRSRIVY